MDLNIVYRAVGESYSGAVEVGPEAVDSAGAMEYGRLKLESQEWYSFTVEERYTGTPLPMPRPGPAKPERPDVEGWTERGVLSADAPSFIPPPFLPTEILAWEALRDAAERAKEEAEDG